MVKKNQEDNAADEAADAANPWHKRDALMVDLGLVEFQDWLAEVGWDDCKSVERGLAYIGQRQLAGLIAEFPGDQAKLKTTLAAAKKIMRAKTEARSSTPKQEQLELYLQGLGSTVLVAMVTPDSTKNQEIVNELALDIGTGLAHLEQSLCTHNETLGGLESQRTVEAYNHIGFNSDTHAITGWCNTDRSMPEAKLMPDTEEDKAFVDAVSEMHAFFKDPSLPEVAEIMVRQNYRTATYGKLAFGQEAFIQMRQPTTSDPTVTSQVRDDSRPFDDDWAMSPEMVKARLRDHHVHSL